jgi:hypothetical protein
VVEADVWGAGAGRGRRGGRVGVALDRREGERSGGGRGGIRWG